MGFPLRLEINLATNERSKEPKYNVTIEIFSYLSLSRW